MNEGKIGIWYPQFQKIEKRINKKIHDKDKEIERLNNIIEKIQNDMIYLDSLGINQVKPKTIWERIELLKGAEKNKWVKYYTDTKSIK